MSDENTVAVHSGLHDWRLCLVRYPSSVPRRNGLDAAKNVWPGKQGRFTFNGKFLTQLIKSVSSARVTLVSTTDWLLMAPPF